MITGREQERRVGRVVLLLGPSTGGIRRHVAALVEGLRARGWEVVTAGPAGVLEGLAHQDALVEVPARLRPAALARARRQLAELAGGAALVHAHGLKAGLLAASLRPRPALVVTVHNVVLGSAGPAGPLLRLLEQAVPAVADRVLAVSEGVAARFRRRDRVVVTTAFASAPTPARDGASLRRDLGVPDGAPLVVSVGRLHPQKGFGTLLEAMQIVRRRLPEARAVVVGDGPLRPRLESDARRLGLEDVVLFTGSVPNSADHLAAAGVVAIPSTWESGPLVLLEALHLGRPVVATPVGVAPDYLVDGESGRVVPVGDAAALADALTDLLADPEGAAALGEAGRRRLQERHVVGREIDRIVEVYGEVLDERRRR